MTRRGSRLLASPQAGVAGRLEEVARVKTLAEVDRDLVAALRDYLESYASHLPVRTVAVVGNAPLEPSAERQAAIDSADLVLRCNGFVLDEPGGPPRLGTKTDVVLLARKTRLTPWVLRDYPRRAYLMNAGSVFKPGILDHPAWWPEDLAAWPLPNRAITHPLQVLISPDTNGRGVMPTTGTLSVYLARLLFSPEARLLVTGFSFLHDPGQTEWSHQAGDTSIVHPAHRLDRESELLQSWVDDGSATFIH